MGDLYYWRGHLNDRDVEYSDTKQITRTKGSLAAVISTLEARRVLGKTYPSHQGATITPRPLWVVEIRTARLHVGGGKVDVIPDGPDESGSFKVRTSRAAQQVRGQGPEKEKWRGLALEGRACPPYLFGLVAARHLLPFVVLHRELAYLPAVALKESEGLGMLDHLAKRVNGQKSILEEQVRPCEAELEGWVRKAQSLWSARKKESAPELCTQRLDYHGALSRQATGQIRVVHPRSGVFAAAVLSPSAEGLLGIPLSQGIAKYRRDSQILTPQTFTLSGLTVDNLLHFIEVYSEDEAYWLVGLMNSTPFVKALPDKADTYSAPSRLLEKLGPGFDPENPDHRELTDLARKIESKARELFLDALNTEVDLNQLDDTESSPEYPRMNRGTAWRLLRKNAELEDLLVRLNELGEAVISKA